MNLIVKPGEPPTEVTSYRPMSLLSLLIQILNILEEQKTIQWFPSIPRNNKTNLQYCIHNQQYLEQKEYCSAAFLDIQQAYYRVWFKGLLCKLNICSPHTAYMLFKSYSQHQIFQVKTVSVFIIFIKIQTKH